MDTMNYMIKNISGNGQDNSQELYILTLMILIPFSVVERMRDISKLMAIALSMMVFCVITILYYGIEEIYENNLGEKDL